MSIGIRLPNITAETVEGQIWQMKSYLCQLAQELEFAVNVPQNVVEIPAVGRQGKTDFAAVKALIIKSADIVNAYYEQMNEKFRGSYAALSDFGSFQERTEQEIRKTSTEISQIFENRQEISSRVDAVAMGLEAARQGLDGIIESVQEVKAVIRTGLLYTDGVPVYGLEIGQQVEQDGTAVFRRFCRLVADRLSFFDAGGNEVAYLSDNRMYITGVETEQVQARALAGERIQMGEYLWAVGADGHLSLI